MSLFRGPPHLKWCTSHYGRNQRRHTVVVPSRVSLNGTDRWHIIILQSAAQRVSQQLFGCGSYEIVVVLCQQKFLQPSRSFELSAVRQLARRVDHAAAVLGPPLPDTIIVLQRESDRIHSGVAGRADGIAP